VDIILSALTAVTANSINNKAINFVFIFLSTLFPLLPSTILRSYLFSNTLKYVCKVNKRQIAANKIKWDRISQNQASRHTSTYHNMQHNNCAFYDPLPVTPKNITVSAFIASMVV